MTEEDAKTRWCPYGRIWSDSGAAYNRTGQAHNFDAPSVNSLCLGSACMAWQWTEPPLHDEKLKKYQTMQGGPKGYCGLADKP